MSKLTQGHTPPARNAPLQLQGIVSRLHLVECTGHNVGLSNFAAAHTLHLFACRLQLTSQLAPLKTSVFARETANHVEMISEEHIVPFSTQDDNSSEGDS